MLRITDIILRNLIHEMIHRDNVEHHNGRSSKYLVELEDTIRSCGITFKVTYISCLNRSVNIILLTQKVWKCKDGKGGRTSDTYDWTSLRGHDKKSF